jgi:hypothetical protein
VGNTAPTSFSADFGWWIMSAWEAPPPCTTSTLGTVKATCTSTGSKSSSSSHNNNTSGRASVKTTYFAAAVVVMQEMGWGMVGRARQKDRALAGKGEWQREQARGRIHKGGGQQG